MSTSKKTRSIKPVAPSAWHQVASPMLGEQSQLIARHPVVKRVALARPGQLVTTTAGCGALAIIELCTSDLCIVRFEDGRPAAFFWGEVELAAVQPHPRYIVGKKGA